MFLNGIHLVSGFSFQLRPLSALEDLNHFVRREAAKSLGRIGDGRANPVLILALKDDDRVGCGGATGELADMKENALGPLISALKPKFPKFLGARSDLSIQ